MADIIYKLERDHQNVRTLLGLLTQQMTHFAAGEYVDYQILTDIMHYFVHQPDVHHHPQEDIIFKLLMRKDVNVADLVDEITAEHQTLTAASAKIFDDLKLIQGNAILSRGEIVNRIKDFISLYQEHMRKEEEGLFKPSLSKLDATDWREIDAETENQEDPLFGKILTDEYRKLYRMILSEDKESLRTLPKTGG
jgi:hemerythrin-like domain-containing protein